MPLKVNIGLSKKIGQRDYGSLGASCHVEFEMDGSYDNGSTEHFQDAVHRAYVACRQAVETEIASSQGNTSNASPVVSNGYGTGGQHSPSTVNRVASYEAATTAPNQTNSSVAQTGGGGGRSATPSQVRAIHAISRANQIDLPAVLSSQYRVHLPESLSIRDASALIDQLKGTANTDTGPVAR